MYRKIQQMVSQAEEQVSKWTEEYAGLNNVTSKFAVEAEQRLDLILDSDHAEFESVAIDRFLDSFSEEILKIGTRAVDALWAAMQHVQHAEQFIDENRMTIVPLAEQIKVGITAVQKRIEVGQAATSTMIRDAIKYIAPFSLDQVSVYEQRLDRLKDRVDSLPWKVRSDPMELFFDDLLEDDFRLDDDDSSTDV